MLMLPWALCRFSGSIIAMVWLAGGMGAVAHAQSATVSEIQAVSTNVTMVNGGGFAIVSDGGLIYDGPLNAITPLAAVTGARVVLNDVVVLDGVPAEVQALVDSGRARSNALSPELVSARIDVTQRDSVMLGIGGRVPMPTAIGGSLESLRIEQVSGQSFSVFPDLQPSVFNRNAVLP
jgi:hypothetical protein